MAFNLLNLVAAAPSSDWGQFHGDAAHNGYSNSKGPVYPVMAWNSSVGYTNIGLIAGGGELVFSSPASSYPPDTYAVISETNGSLLYNIQSLPPANSYAVISGSSVFNVAERNRLSSCNLATGAFQWGVNIPQGSKPSVFYGSAGVSYYLGQVFGVSFGASTITALSSSSGSQNWQVNLAGAIDTIPTIGNGVLVVGFSNLQGISAVSATSGAQLWNFTANGLVNACPAYDSDSANFFFGTLNGTLYCVSQSGQQIWANHVGNGIETTPTIANGLVFFGTDNGTLLALNSTSGNVAWQLATKSQLLSPPAVASNGILYQATSGGLLYALSAANGTGLWTYNLGYGVSASPVIDNGEIFLVDSQGTIFAIANSSPPVPELTPVALIAIFAVVSGAVALYKRPRAS